MSRLKIKKKLSTKKKIPDNKWQRIGISISLLVALLHRYSMFFVHSTVGLDFISCALSPENMPVCLSAEINILYFMFCCSFLLRTKLTNIIIRQYVELVAKEFFLRVGWTIASFETDLLRTSGKEGGVHYWSLSRLCGAENNVLLS